MRVDADGIHIRQSEINDWLTCQERFRLSMIESHRSPDMRHESDAALVGTVIHAAIETELSEGEITKTRLDEIALQKYSSECERMRSDPNIVFNEATYNGRDSKAYEDIVDLVDKWFDSDVRKNYLRLSDGLVEWEFDVPFTQIDGLDVYLTGTSDLVIPNVAVVDWKTAGREYQRWEKQRWAVQPSVYTYAAHYEGFFKKDRIEFLFYVFPRGRSGSVQTVSVWRDRNHWDWLRKQIGPMVKQVISGGPTMWREEWQMNDQSALCSDKWCPYWSECKGAHMLEGWDK